ncbi:phytoene synthase [Sphingomonas guangdongensis]|uniref:Phytoene synthase n=1 Tax=Sphingomonas guangdongensis TaxID=1141890 RepID=A0A285R5E0_9SPHN|nr:squalene/phytoene synthase family protein [Sphingomonas guangdongensis]SOB87572.1 phytoene synthase [Sphingomonas guangdongensis]
MVNSPFTPEAAADDPRAAERRVVLSYVPADARAGMAALLALDDQLANIVRTTREPMVGQMRLTWWHDAIARLETAAPPAQPVLEALASRVVPVCGAAAFLPAIDGWEVLLEPELGDDDLATYAAGRGALFAAAAVLMGEGAERIGHAGEAWALHDLAAHVRDPALAARARRLAQARQERRRWPVRLRALGALTSLARDHDRAPAVRIGRALWLRLTGY